jgi:mono/diheme cytochrome c family protein
MKWRWLLLVLPALVTGCDLPGRPNPADRPVPANEVLEFAALYKQNCAGCHGADGKLGPAPPLNDPLFLALAPDAVLQQVITEGRPGTPMPAFAHSKGGSLTDAQVDALAAGVKTHWRPMMPAPKGAPPYLPGPGQPETRPGKPGGEVIPQPPRPDAPPKPEAVQSGSKAAGATTFARACAVCHGDDGRGVPKGDRRANALHDPVFLALISDQALRRLVITGRPDLGMPDYAGPRPGQPDFRPLTPEQVNDLVALLASWRSGPSTDGKRAVAWNAEAAARPPQ